LKQKRLSTVWRAFFNGLDRETAASYGYIKEYKGPSGVAKKAFKGRY
jgi:hypothetical protein